MFTFPLLPSLSSCFQEPSIFFLAVSSFFPSQVEISVLPFLIFNALSLESLHEYERPILCIPLCSLYLHHLSCAFFSRSSSPVHVYQYRFYSPASSASPHSMSSFFSRTLICPPGRSRILFFPRHLPHSVSTFSFSSPSFFDLPPPLSPPYVAFSFPQLPAPRLGPSLPGILLVFPFRQSPVSPAAFGSFPFRHFCPAPFFFSPLLPYNFQPLPLSPLHYPASQTPFCLSLAHSLLDPLSMAL